MTSRTWTYAFFLLLAIQAPASAQTPASAADSQSQAVLVGRGGKAGLGAIASTDKRIAALQNQVTEGQTDFARYDRLGNAYLQKARETGDIAYYDLAEKALDKSVALTAENATADPLVHLALVYMGEHRFADALIAAQKAIAAGSGSLTALAVEGDAYTDLGEHTQAVAAYNSLQTLGKEFASPLTLTYIADSRISYLTFLQGDTAESIRLMRNAIVAALQLNISSENLAWLYYELGQRYFQGGDLQHAEIAYNSALSAHPTHYRSLAGLGQVRASQGRFGDAIDLYKSSLQIVPFPQYIAELGDVYLKCGRHVEAQQQYDLVEYIGHLGKLNQVLSNRELALFYADRNIKLGQALQLARSELDVRHDVYTWDTLAWVLYRNHRFEEAKEAMGKALLLHTNDPLLLFHAGEIEHAVGNNDNAKSDLSKALAINPGFHIFYAQQATDILKQLSRDRQRNSHNAGN